MFILDTILNSAIQINTYGSITAINSNGTEITINSKSLGNYGDFSIKDRVMIHVPGGTDATVVGKYGFFYINSVNNNILTLNKSCNNIITSSQLSSFKVQVISIPVFNNLTISSGITIQPLAYNGTVGGIIILDCINNITINGKIDASFMGYKRSYIAPNNGGVQASGNTSYGGGSNQFKGGNGGVNYQGYVGYAPNPVGKQDLSQMLFGGGSSTSTGGGIVYIHCNNLILNNSQCLSANGKGGTGSTNGGGAGGCIFINSYNISGTNVTNYFVGATGGGGGGEYSNRNWLQSVGKDGTNVIGGDGGASGDSGTAGKGFASNGGGGTKVRGSAYSATVTQGGNGSGYNNSTTGWNAGAGGGGGYIGIFTNSRDVIKTLTLYPTPYISDFQYENYFLIKDGETNNIKRTINGTSVEMIGSTPFTKEEFINLGMINLTNINNTIIGGLNENKFNISIYKR